MRFGTIILTICLAGCIEPGDYDLSFWFNGAETVYKLFVPDNFDGTVVIDLHGHGSDPADERIRSNLLEPAELLGFAVANPRGYGTVASWNGGTCCGDAMESNDDVDHVGTMRALDEHIRARLDVKRLIIHGFSNGGFLAHRLACEAPELADGYSVVSGVLGVDCENTSPTKMLYFHGEADPYVPFNGGLGYESAPNTVAAHASRLGCTTSITEWVGPYECDVYVDCDFGAELVFCPIPSWGHAHPTDWEWVATDWFLGVD